MGNAIALGLVTVVVYRYCWKTSRRNRRGTLPAAVDERLRRSWTSTIFCCPCRSALCICKLLCGGLACLLLLALMGAVLKFAHSANDGETLVDIWQRIVAARLPRSESRTENVAEFFDRLAVDDD